MNNLSETGVIFALVRDKKVLMQQRDGNCKKFPLKWCVPGGALEEGESHEETLLREIKEEYYLDMKIEDCTFLMDYHAKNKKVYVCNVGYDQEPKLGEGMDMRWVPVEEIEKLDLGFDQEELIEELKKIILAK